VRAATRVNAAQASKRTMCRPTINAIIGKDFQPDAELLGYMEAS